MRRTRRGWFILAYLCSDEYRNTRHSPYARSLALRRGSGRRLRRARRSACAPWSSSRPQWGGYIQAQAGATRNNAKTCRTRSPRGSLRPVQAVGVRRRRPGRSGPAVPQHRLVPLPAHTIAMRPAVARPAATGILADARESREPAPRVLVEQRGDQNSAVEERRIARRWVQREWQVQPLRPQPPGHRQCGDGRLPVVPVDEQLARSGDS